MRPLRRRDPNPPPILGSLEVQGWGHRSGQVEKSWGGAEPHDSVAPTLADKFADQTQIFKVLLETQI